MNGPLAVEWAYRSYYPPVCQSDRNLGLDVRVGLVALELEVLVLKSEQVALVGDRHGREVEGLASQLPAGLVQVVQVEVRVAEGVDELARLQAHDLGDHQGQQGVGGDIERHAQEHVGAALVELAAELSIRHEELEQAVTGRQGHVVDVGRVPGRDDVAAAA